MDAFGDGTDIKEQTMKKTLIAAAVALAIVAGGVAAASRWRGGRGSSVIDVVAA